MGVDWICVHLRLYFLSNPDINTEMKAITATDSPLPTQIVSMTMNPRFRNA